MVGHQDQAALLGERDHRRAGLDAVGQRLLDQHVLAGAQGRLGDAAVRAGRRRDGDGVDVVASRARPPATAVTSHAAASPTTCLARSRSRSQTARSAQSGEDRKLRIRLGPQ